MIINDIQQQQYPNFYQTDQVLNEQIHLQNTNDSVGNPQNTILANIQESPSISHRFIHSKEPAIKEEPLLFSTVTDVRQFYQFLRSTSGIKYWNFFIDSMRLLQSRPNRIDISYLNFINKYYSRHHEFCSIKVDFGNSPMPDSSTPDSTWFQMAINAMNQLRVYWLSRYLNRLHRSEKPPTTMESKSKPAEKMIKQSTENNIVTPINHTSQADVITEESRLVNVSLENISYVDYRPGQYICVQPSKQHKSQDDVDESNDNNNKQLIDTDSKLKCERPPYSISDRSIEDYATDANIELFYRILVSDSLAGSPFLEYISQTASKTDTISLHTCIHCIVDAEILLSIPSGKLKEKILQQFIFRYFEVTAIEAFPNRIFDNIEQERNELIQELIRNNDTNEYFLFWKLVLKITKFLIPHYLNYIKFDRLRFLIKGKFLSDNSIIDDLHHLLPSINFDALVSNRQNVEQNNLNKNHTQEMDILSRTRPTNCHEQHQHDLLKSYIKKYYHTTEKQINTDERCEFRPGERFPPLTDHELEQELRGFCTKLEQETIETILGKSFDIRITPQQTSITTFIGDPVSNSKIKQTLTSNENLKLNLIEAFTHEIINSGLEIFEIDRFISNIMDETLQRIQLNSIKSDSSSSSSSSSSSVYEDAFVTDSSSRTTLSQVITKDINTNAFVTSNSESELIRLEKPIERKILSTHGSYFINSPNTIKHTDSFISQSNSLPITSIDPIIYTNLRSINEFSFHQQCDSFAPSYRGVIKELTIDNIGIGHLHIDLTKTNIISNKDNILKLNNNKIKLYKNNHVEFLLANIKSYNIYMAEQELYLCLDNFKLRHDSSKINMQQFDEKENYFYESIKFAQKDESSEINNSVTDNNLLYLQNNNEKNLLEFIQNEIHNHQWPLHEYIGVQGQRAWRALKLAADISNFDDGFMLNYHNDLDWISTDNNYGSFNQRTSLIVRNLEQRIAKQKLSNHKNNYFQ
ncbi:unnamed protein product [Rotaria magnacalcarata]|uniref:RGS domain-containing protein n=1 Tax=Rotaria magnacalcarata TaxID=392030 RepID=A0A816V261_9BILA|nr:unnamed protein product [Rotaria magnacalcarata]CAF2257991.1 unnamed protein product [Rotaria magnacalcarata]